MFPNLNQLIRSYEPHEVLLEMAVIWAGVYLVFRFLRGTRGAGIVKGFAVLLVALTVLIRLGAHGTDAFGRVDFLYQKFLGLLAIFLLVVFQPELRQAMIRLGQTSWIRAARPERSRVINAVGEAVGFLSKSQFGALIAIERDVKLGGLVEGGQTIDAKISARLLESIFWPNSPLHDLGVVIRGDRIVAAGVQFPLAEAEDMPPQYGSRHRAAIGLSMETDSVVVIVSEENGAISIAERGRIHYDIPREDFAERLAAVLEAPAPDEVQTSAPAPTREQPEPETATFDASVSADDEVMASPQAKKAVDPA
jgi:diadenylate cyclase